VSGAQIDRDNAPLGRIPGITQASPLQRPRHFGRLQHLTLPAIGLALLASAYILRQTRASVISVLDQDVVTFARARGLSASRITLAYALRNGLIPTITVSAP
jgi:ABC-type dipeptide/oligopeptide/nickel transport system permease component